MMKTTMILLCIGTLSFSAFATSRTDVGNAIGKVILGEEYKEGESVESSLAGQANCSISLKISSYLNEDNKSEVESFTLEARKNGKSVLIQPFKPQSLSLKTSQNTSKLSFSSEGPCLGGSLWGSRCDKQLSTIIVKRNSKGSVKSIELKNTVDLLIDRSEDLKCEF